MILDKLLEIEMDLRDIDFDIAEGKNVNIRGRIFRTRDNVNDLHRELLYKTKQKIDSTAALHLASMANHIRWSYSGSVGQKMANLGDAISCGKMAAELLE